MSKDKSQKEDKAPAAKQEAPAPKKEAAKPSKVQDALAADEVLVLPVKAQQERMVFVKPVHIRTQGTTQVIDGGEKLQILDSAFNPETKRFEHQISERAVMDGEQTEKELLSRGWIKNA